MTEYHALTHASGAILLVLALMIAGFTVLSIRGYIAHRRTEASSHAARGSSANSFLLGLSLPTLLRLSSVGTCLFSCLCVLTALLANWLALTDRRDEGLRYISPVENPSSLDVSSAGKLCMTTSKLGPPIYVLAKMCTYLFFFFKSRTVVTNQKMGWFHKGVLFITCQVAPFSASGIWLIQGDVSKLDRTCVFYIQIWQIILMAAADVNLSAIYCYLFIAPLRETINANKATRRVAKVSPAETALTSPSTAATASAAAAAARGSALEAVLRKNMVSCVGTIISTTCAMLFMLVAHVIDEPYMRKLSNVIGVLDLVVTCFSIAHLMHKSPASASAAAAKDAVTRKHAPITSGTGGRHPVAAAAAAPEMRDSTVIGGASQRRSDNGLSPVHAPARLPVSPTGVQLDSHDAPIPLHNRYMLTPEPLEADERSTPVSPVAAGELESQPTSAKPEIG